MVGTLHCRAWAIDEFRGYCDSDVLNLVLGWLAHQRLRGLLAAEDHERVVDEVRRYLAGQQARRPHRGVFLSAWSAG